MSQYGGIFIVFLAVSVIVVFLICRELVCWYLKVNARLDAQAELLVKMDRLIGLQCDWMRSQGVEVKNPEDAPVFQPASKPPSQQAKPLTSRERIDLYRRINR